MHNLRLFCFKKRKLKTFLIQFIEDSVEVTQASLFSIPEKIHGQVANLNVYGHNFQEINFDFVPQPNWWLLDINAKELRGSAKFYPDWLSQGIDIDADFIHLITTQPEIGSKKLRKIHCSCFSKLRKVHCSCH